MGSSLALLWDAPHYAAAVVSDRAVSALVASTSDGAADEPLAALQPVVCHEPDGLRRDEWAEWIAPQLRPLLVRDGSDASIEAAGDGSVDGLVVVLPRDRVTWRMVALPPGPAEERPAMVAMQLSTQVAGGLESSVVDYLHEETETKTETKTDGDATSVEAGNDDGLDRVAAAALPHDVLATLRALADRLGCPLRWVGPSSVALDALLRDGWRADLGKPNGRRVLLAAGERSVESITRHRGRLVGAAGCRHGQASAAAAIETETRRQRMQQLADDVDTESSAVVPLTEHLDEVCLFGGAAAAKRGGLNFAAPHRPPPPKNDGRKYALLGAAAAAALLAAWLWNYTDQMRDLDDAIAAARDRADSSGEFVETRGEARERAADIAAVQAELPPIAEVMTRLTQSVGDRRRVLLGQLVVTPKKGDVLAGVSGTGFAADRAAFEAFEDRAAQSGLVVRGQAATASDARDGYPVAFRIDMDLPANAVASPDEDAGQMDGATTDATDEPPEGA